MEWRKCSLTNQWYLIGAKEIEVDNVKYDKCPFCPGGEYEKMKVIDRIADEKEQVISIPNPKASLRIDDEVRREGVGFFDMMNNIGADEIIIETLNQHKPLGQFSENHLLLVFKMFARRIADLKNDTRFRQILIFRNQNEYCGKPFQHPFSRLIAFPMVPKAIDNELIESRKHYQRKDRCLLCDILTDELRTGTRVIIENDAFVAYCPYASRFPYEVWIAPKFHECAYEKIDNTNNLRLLSKLLHKLLPKLEKITPAYFMALHSSPNEKSAIFKNHQWESLQNDYHWHIEIIPRLTEVAGFEWGTGTYINPMLPEKAAI
jgi:UDPglucose--hexose-1-phosphate uridylyltransferase